MVGEFLPTNNKAISKEWFYFFTKIMANARQKLAVKYMAEGMTEEKALLKAGYSASYARSGNIKIRTGFNDLLEKNLPDAMLFKVHKEGLGASKKVFKNNNESGEVELVGEEPDYSTRHKYLDSAYKIKGKYPKEGTNVAIQINISKILDELENEQ